jgi:hypothetical protein
LALLYLFAGSVKLILPVAELTRQMAFPGTFLWFIGGCEVPGAVGLILPGFLGRRQELTPVAALGLSIIYAWRHCAPNRESRYRKPADADGGRPAGWIAGLGTLE